MIILFAGKEDHVYFEDVMKRVQCRKADEKVQLYNLETKQCTNKIRRDTRMCRERRRGSEKWKFGSESRGKRTWEC